MRQDSVAEMCYRSCLQYYRVPISNPLSSIPRYVLFIIRVSDWGIRCLEVWVYLKCIQSLKHNFSLSTNRLSVPFYYCSFHYTFVKDFLAITFLLLVISNWNFHDVCQRYLCNQKQHFSWIRQKMRNFPIDPHNYKNSPFM